MRSITNTHTLLTHRAFALISIAEPLFGGLAAIARRISDRRAVRSLLSYDDYQLKDIGLSRADVECELTKPLLWRNGR